jgi:ComF family protein
MFGAVPVAVNRKDAFMSTIAKRLRATLLHAVLPPTCCLCGAQGDEADLDLCTVCLKCLPLNAPADDASSLFVQTLVRVLVPFQYAYPVDQLVRGLKFRGERVYARVLGTLLARSFRALRQSPPQLIVPIPLHAQRYRERGFNQSHELARFAAARLGIALDTRCIVRKLRTLEQSGLSLTQRRRNVRGAFEVVRPISAQRVALVDDVLTTGSTALAAAHAVLQAGVPEVELWAVARVTLG